jgi:hypothetical protein
VYPNSKFWGWVRGLVEFLQRIPKFLQPYLEKDKALN